MLFQNPKKLSQFGYSITETYVPWFKIKKFFFYIIFVENLLWNIERLSL